MAHFAQLDDKNKVINVIVIDDKNTLDKNGIENEEAGIAFCKSLFGENTKWIQTSYNANIRGAFAGIGYTYDLVNDVFVPDSQGYTWIAPEPEIVNVEEVTPTPALEG